MNSTAEYLRILACLRARLLIKYCLPSHYWSLLPFTVDFAAMTNLNNQHRYLLILYCGIQPIVTNAVAPKLGQLSLERLTDGPWIIGNTLFQEAKNAPGGL